MKQKTHQGAKKRIKVSKTGNIFKGAVNNSHLKRKQASNVKHRKKKFSEMSKGFTKRLRRLVNI